MKGGAAGDAVGTALASVSDLNGDGKAEIVFVQQDADGVHSVSAVRTMPDSKPERLALVDVPRGAPDDAWRAVAPLIQIMFPADARPVRRTG